MFALLQERELSPGDMESLSDFGSRMTDFCALHPGESALQLALIRYHMVLGDEEAAITVTREYCSSRPAEREGHYRVYNKLVAAFPGSRPLRQDRAQIAIGLGCFDVAREDLEFAANAEDQ